MKPSTPITVSIPIPLPVLQQTFEFPLHVIEWSARIPGKILKDFADCDGYC
jgi:hypothetical protein